MKFLFRASLLASTAAILAACGGGSDGGPSLTPGGGSSGTGGSGQTAGTTEYRFGSLSGGSFSAGAISTNRSSLEAGQSAALSVSIIDQNGNLVTEAATVLFSSPCIASSLSELSDNNIANTTGTITTTYTSRGCDGNDVITAQTSIGGNSYSASVQLTATPSPLGSIGFVSASPQIIGIKGSGAIPEQSVVSFKVTNSSGGPVQNQTVDFTLNNTTGGIGLSTTQDITDANGIASTTVTAGTIATTVSVSAKATQGSIESTAQSSALAVTTGIPDQNSFSLSASILNIEGLAYDGTTTTLTIRAADRFNNPVPDDTAITFRAEGASVQPSCTTTGGACSVELTSQQPRPADGRVTILATAVGEESFVDANPSNGQYDDAETFTDLPEAFLDEDEDGVFDANTEPYVDQDNEGDYDGANGKYNGLLCKGPSKCDTNSERVTLRESIVIVLSGSSFNVNLSPASVNLDGGTATVVVSIADINGQVPPAGTTIKVETDQGTISGPAQETMLSTNAQGPAVFAFRIKQGSKAGQGTFSVEVTTPKGVISRAFANVNQTVTPP